MRNKLEQNTLTLFFEGEVNSYNAEDVEKEIDDIVKRNSFKTIVIDMEKLNYISSAGLRIIVRLKQQYDDVTLVKVPGGVYDVFLMVGFENLIKIERLG